MLARRRNTTLPSPILQGLRLKVNDLHDVGREAARDSGLLLVPSNLEDVALALEAADVHARLDVPDV